MRNEIYDDWMLFPDEASDHEGGLLIDGDAPFHLDDPISPDAMVDALIKVGANRRQPNSSHMQS